MQPHQRPSGKEIWRMIILVMLPNRSIQVDNVVDVIGMVRGPSRFHWQCHGDMQDYSTVYQRLEMQIRLEPLVFPFHITLLISWYISNLWCFCAVTLSLVTGLTKDQRMIMRIATSCNVESYIWFTNRPGGCYTLLRGSGKVSEISNDSTGNLLIAL